MRTEQPEFLAAPEPVSFAPSRARLLSGIAHSASPWTSEFAEAHGVQIPVAFPDHSAAAPAGTLAAATPLMSAGEAESLNARTSRSNAWLETMARSVAVGRDLLSVIIPAMMLALVVHFFLAQATIVFGQSMEPNLSPYQRLIVEKFSYRLWAPQRNDIVVVNLPRIDDMLVKRVVGLPGETIEVRKGSVYVNGKLLPEPFPHDVDYATTAPLRLEAHQYFVLGDNRDNSNDSRIFGPVSTDDIVGRVWLRYWPLQRFTLF